MYKRIIAFVLVMTLFNLTVSCAFAETQAQIDARQQRTVSAAIGIAALVGTLLMLSKMGRRDLAEYYSPSFINNDFASKNLIIGFDIYEPDFAYSDFEEKNEYVPMLRFSYSL